MDFELLFDFSLSMFIASCTEIEPNGLGLGEGVDFQHQLSYEAL